MGLIYLTLPLAALQQAETGITEGLPALALSKPTHTRDFDVFDEPLIDDRAVHEPYLVDPDYLESHEEKLIREDQDVALAFSLIPANHPRPGAQAFLLLAWREEHFPPSLYPDVASPVLADAASPDVASLVLADAASPDVADVASLV